MNRFRKLGFITCNGHIEVRKSLPNLVLHEHPHIENWPKAPHPRSSGSGRVLNRVNILARNPRIFDANSTTFRLLI